MIVVGAQPRETFALSTIIFSEQKMIVALIQKHHDHRRKADDGRGT
jgi:hypothetical protein